ncbi:MAG: endopeptidase La, partial [Deltaproteobacteria bacterium]|nr:endopeptidase La [Deltaproteobacteria bacterium]
MSRNNTQSPVIYPLPTLEYDLEYNSESEAEIFTVPETIRLLPMVELNSFPKLVSSISIEDPRTIDYLNNGNETHILALFALKNTEVDPFALTKEDFYQVGIAARVLSVEDEENEDETGSLKVTVLGLSRIGLNEVYPNVPMVSVAPLDEAPENDESLKPLIQEAKRLFAEAILLIPGHPINLFKINRVLEGQPEVLADLIVATLPLSPAQKAEYLLIKSLKLRYHKLLEFLTMEVASRKAGRAISARIENNLANRHRELHLREQLKAIKEELGENNDDSEDIQEIALRLERTELREVVRTAANRDLQRLRLTPLQSAEYSNIRNFLEWLVDLPWTKADESLTDLPLAREILDRDHQGLESVKKRILEFLAVHKLTNNLKAPILCLTGPPGVGKTTLGRSIAEAMGRKFLRLSLGGLRDEAEIRGHRKTYVGSNPGRIISGLRKIGVNNPVFLLDEIDKMGQSQAGDPASALLEVLDPEQNETFTDNYLELPFDLSNVLFILTANVVENIPGPLRDRLEIIEVNGYTLDEKVTIAERHLWPKELVRHGLKPGDVEIAAGEIEHLVVNYTWEAGCRDLSRKLGAVVRSRAMAKAENLERPLSVSKDELKTVLGPPCRRQEDKREKDPQIGVVTGLAWTAAGGDIMFVEAVAMPGKGNLSLTGQLGEVMKESALAGLCYVRSRARDWFLYDGWFKENDIHIHLPHGAIPKDGPS